MCECFPCMNVCMLPEKRVRTPGNDIKGGYALWVVGKEPRSPARIACALYF